MWIRSQNKKRLMKCDNLSIRNGECLLKGKFIIENNGITLGIYSTEGKALKVLDMLERHIKAYLAAFQMPQDSEV